MAQLLLRVLLMSRCGECGSETRAKNRLWHGRKPLCGPCKAQHRERQAICDRQPGRCPRCGDTGCMDIMGEHTFRCSSCKHEVCL